MNAGEELSDHSRRSGLISPFAPLLLENPTRSGAFSGMRLFGLSGFEWSDDKVVAFGQDICRQKVDLKLDLLGVLGIRRADISK